MSAARSVEDLPEFAGEFPPPGFEPAHAVKLPDTEAHIAAIPEDCSLKGMFIQTVVELGVRHGYTPLRDKYIAFRDYPVEEWARVLLGVAPHAFPDLDPSAAVRELGRLAFPTFRDSLLGRVILGVAGRNVRAVLRVVPRAYQATNNHTQMSVVLGEGDSALIALRNVWDFAPVYQAGVYQGGIEALGATGEVWVRTHGPSGVDLAVRWSKDHTAE